MDNSNLHFQKLQTAYIFPIIEKKLESVQGKVINLGVGDISLPLAPSVADAICQATQEMTQRPIGYGPSHGYRFLREVICHEEYAPFGIEPEEVFISEGVNSDVADLLQLFDSACSVLVHDPSYPVYRDASLIAGKEVITLPLKEEEGFLPKPPPFRTDLVYLCTPSNPIGEALKGSELEEWIDWAKTHRSILIIDNVYQPFVSSPDVPPSIYALKGGREVAIEMRSFSKGAGFTGLRCGYTVIPKSLHISKLHSNWSRLINIQRNGISYPIQKGAEACFTPIGKKETQKQIDIYKNTGSLFREILKKNRQTFFGGIDAPYIWWKVPQGRSSWEFFDQLLERSRLLTIPGSGFGPGGEGYIRLSCFQTQQTAIEACNALRDHFDTAQLLS
jgi:LL-diaminopimelate aminotransferase